MKLVASMICRNELDRYLTLALSHLQTFCDEIRVLDDGSTDGTYEWLTDQPGVYTLRNPGPEFYEYESKARQNLLEWTMEGKPDYVLSIDADEFIDNPNKIREAVDRGQPIYTLEMVEIWGATKMWLDLRVDGHWGPRKCPILWRAPVKLDDTVWLIPDRKLACGREPLAVRRGGFEPTSAGILHFGWARRSEREARAERYEVHDKGEFHKNAHLQSILWPDERVKMTQIHWPQTLRPFASELLERVRR